MELSDTSFWSSQVFFAYPTLEYLLTKNPFETECYVDFLGVPVSGQKMICSGKQLNTGEGWMDKSIKEVSATKVEQPGFDRSRSCQVDFLLYPDSISQAGLKTGSKVMLLGKKYDPAQEEGYRKVTLKLQKKVNKTEFCIIM